MTVALTIPAAVINAANEECFRPQKGSITNGEGSPAGWVGEWVFSQHFLSAKRLWKNPEADFLLPNDELLDVKTKRTSTFGVQPHYVGSVKADSHDGDRGASQICQWYAFCRVNLTAKCGWYCGSISKVGFFEQATLIRRGSSDGSDNGFKSHATMWNIPYSQLTHSPWEPVHNELIY
jgi:hypothetical protein